MQNLTMRVSGHVQISGELDKFNSINVSNLATLIGRGLTRVSNSNIFKLMIGIGGLNPDGTLRPAKVTPIDTSLYSPLNQRSIIIDQQDENAGDGSSAVFSTTQNGSVNIVNTIVIKNPLSSSDIVFNELGLFSEDNLMLSHLTFNDIIVQAGTEKTIVYTISFSIVE